MKKTPNIYFFTSLQHWHFSLEDKKNNTFKVNLLLFFFFSGACTDAPKIADICGSEETVLQDSSGLYILIEFSTDYSVTYKGFEMEFYIGMSLFVYTHTLIFSLTNSVNYNFSLSIGSDSHLYNHTGDIIHAFTHVGHGIRTCTYAAI